MRELEISAEISTMRTLTEVFTINNKTALKKPLNSVELTVNSWPEKFPTHGVHRWNMMRLDIAVIY